MRGTTHRNRSTLAESNQASDMDNTTMKANKVETAMAAIVAEGTDWSGSCDSESRRPLVFLTSKIICRITSRKARVPTTGPTTPRSNTWSRTESRLYLSFERRDSPHHRGKYLSKTLIALNPLATAPTSDGDRSIELRRV